MRKTIYFAAFLLLCISLFSCKKKSDSVSITNNTRVIEGGFIGNSGYEAICKTTENNIAIVGQRRPGGWLYVAMMNSNLDLLWEKTFYGSYDNAGGITASDDGGVVIASNLQHFDGTIEPAFFLNLKKLNSKGDLQWEKNYYSRPEYGSMFPIRMTADKGFIIGVNKYILPTDASHYYPTLFKINSQGDSLWSKWIPTMLNCSPLDIALAPDGGFCVSGSCSVYKTDSLGNFLWHSEDVDYGSTLQVLKDGSVVYLSLQDYNMGHVATLTELDQKGNKVWRVMYTEEYSLIMHVFSLCLSDDGGFLFTHSNYDKLKITKTDNKGNKLSEKIMDPVFVSYGLIQIGSRYCHFGHKYNMSMTGYEDLVVNMIDF